MARFVLDKDFMTNTEAAVVRGLNTCGQNAKTSTVAPRTPVLTGFAQRSVHAVVVDASGQVAGDTSDGNGNAVMTYPSVTMPTAIVGSNTHMRPDQDNPGEGYYVGLEMGVLSLKGSNMLADGYTQMAQTVLDDIEAELP